MPAEDDELMHFLRRGEERALEMIFDLFFKPLVYFAIHMGLEKQTAEDVCIIAIQKFAKSTVVFNDRNHVENSLYQSVSRACLNEKRHQQRLERWEKEFDRRYIDKVDFPELQQVKSEQLARLYLCIAKLPERQREAILNSLSGLSDEEIATLMKIDVQTVRNHKTKARLSLKKCCLDL